MAQYKPAVFLDRDGVLTEEKGYVTHVSDLQIFPFARQCIQDIRKMGYWAIVVTNQSAVARGLLKEETLLRMNEILRRETGVDAVYYCPHHPEAEAEAYQRQCDCRKPQPGMFLQAMREFAVDRGHSYMVGERATDILAGQRLGLTTVLVESGYERKRLEFDVEPNYVVKDLRELCSLLAGE